MFGENTLTSKELPHMGFRHTHCSLLFEAGATIKMDIYAHVTQKAKNEVADKFASYIGF